MSAPLTKLADEVSPMSRVDKPPKWVLVMRDSVN